MAEHAGIPQRRISGKILLEKAASLIRIVCGVFAAVLVAYIVLEVFGANFGNGIAEFFRSVARSLVLGFQDLFTFEQRTLGVVVNFGVAALFWLAVGTLVSRILRKFAS